MKQALIRRLHKNFEDYVQVQEGVEFWFARDLQNLLGYTQWRNLLNVIEKAKESCKIQTTKFQTILLASAKWSLSVQGLSDTLKILN